MNLEDIYKEIYYREQIIKELKDKPFTKWTRADSEEYICQNQSLDYLRDEAKRLEGKGGLVDDRGSEKMAE